MGKKVSGSGHKPKQSGGPASGLNIGKEKNTAKPAGFQGQTYKAPSVGHKMSRFGNRGK